MKSKVTIRAILENAEPLVHPMKKVEQKGNMVSLKFKAFWGFSLGYKPAEHDPKWRLIFHTGWYRRFWPTPRWCRAPQKDK
ncbi:MAG: hypothetical protein RLZZ617_295, partial [Bacteroidota bacterium]